MPITVKEFKRGKVCWWRNLLPKYSRLNQFWRWLKCKIGGYGKFPMTKDEWEMWYRTPAQRTLDRMQGRW